VRRGGEHGRGIRGLRTERGDQFSGGTAVILADPRAEQALFLARQHGRRRRDRADVRDVALRAARVPGFPEVLQFPQAEHLGVVAQHKAQQRRAGARRACYENEFALGERRASSASGHQGSRCGQGRPLP
jgi:hypothetical protein